MMSTLSATNLKHGSSASNNLVLDANGNVTAAGTVAMASSFLRNRIINGDMRIDQRNAGASVTVGSGAYPVDRWFAVEDTDGALSAEQVEDAPSGFYQSTKITVTTADSSLAASQNSQFRQAIEGYNVSDLNWGTANAASVTLSFWVKSSLTGTFGGSLRNATPDRSYIFQYTINSANTWEYKTVTISGDTSGTWGVGNGVGVYVTFDLGSGTDRNGTANQWQSGSFFRASGNASLISILNATWQITGVQLEVGTIATPFERRLYGQEIAMCYRYAYFTQISGAGIFNGTTVVNVWYSGLNMRSAPTASITGTLKFRNITTGATTTANSPSVVVSPQNSQGGYLEISVSSFSAAPSANNVAALFCDGTNGVLLNSEL